MPVMQQDLHLKSSFSNLKLILAWLILLSAFIFPWIPYRIHFEKGIALFAVFANIIVFAIIIHVKISLAVTIQSTGIVEYHYTHLWGAKRKVTIDIKNAYFVLDMVNYRFNDLWNLTVIDHIDSSKKISLTDNAVTNLF
jgi:hypothetical protein